MARTFPFQPRLVATLRGYSAAAFSADLLAGLTVGIIALSLSMALGIASGATPAVGITTAIVAGFLISALGGSRVQIGGPTAAFIPVVVGVATEFGPANLVVCTILAGLFLIAMGLARLGVMIKYIPVPVITGFTAGIAVYILSTQLKDFLGLHLPDGTAVPADFIAKLQVLTRHLHTLHLPSVLLASASLALLKLWPGAWGRRVPASIAAVVLGTLALAALEAAGVATHIQTIGSRFGPDAIPRSLPAPRLPALDLAQLHHLFRPAFTIALLAAIESLLCAVVADGMIEDRHDSNTELIAQGAANLGSALFGGLPATGALARTAANVRSGARTPVAGMTHALVLLLIALAAAPLARFIPLPVLSAVLVVVALNMGEWRNFARLRGWPRSDTLVFLVSFSLTVLADLTVAVETGMVLAAILFIKRVSETTQITSADERELDLAPADSVLGKDVPRGVVAYQLSGAFLFGAADKLETTLERLGDMPPVLILGMKRVMAIDATGLHALAELHQKLRQRGKWLVLAGPHTQPLLAMSRDGFIDRIGAENVCENMDTALDRARQLLAAPAPTPTRPG